MTKTRTLPIAQIVFVMFILALLRQLQEGINSSVKSSIVAIY